MKANNQFYLNESASNFHNRLREIFVSEVPFSHMTCYQEVNVRELVPEYPYRDHHYDWFIYELGLIIELHGAQHYKPVNYGNQAMSKTVSAFRNMLLRDSLKETAAREAGYDYVVIPYTDEKKLSAQYILNLLE